MARGAAIELTLTLHAEPLAVCRLAPDADLPTWAAGSFTSITRTPAELSIVCPQDSVPPDVRCQRGWRALTVAGPLEFTLTGVLAALTAPLAEARIPLLAVATYDTDWLLVRAADLEHTLAVLQQAGHTIDPE